MYKQCQLMGRTALTTTVLPRLRGKVSRVAIHTKHQSTCAPHPKSIDRVGSAVVPLEPAAAEGQRAKGLVDVSQQLLGPGGAQRHVAVAEVAHVVAALALLQHVSPAGAAEGLDRVELALLHARRVAVLHDRHALAAVDLIRRDAVPL